MNKFPLIKLSLLFPLLLIGCSRSDTNNNGASDEIIIADPIEVIEPVTPVEPIDPVDPDVPIEPIEPANPAIPVEPTDTIGYLTTVYTERASLY